MLLIEQEIEIGVLPAGLDVGSATDVGRVRESNEDALLSVPHASGQQVLVAVADGMGGHNAGEVASAIAVESLERNYTSEQAAQLEEAIVQADLFGGLRLEPGDALVLCSDGVTTYLEPPDFSRELAEAATAQQAAERLVSLAVHRGGADNATAVVVRRL